MKLAIYLSSRTNLLRESVSRATAGMEAFTFTARWRVTLEAGDCYVALSASRSAAPMMQAQRERAALWC